ncbi:HD domain-containing protein [Limobrevibacterium gyesilva]|uniref:HD domain-containing protein n=1 Tax=Limobrevibacterium gyesilva TaxID=2991712 RepID=A0AA41YSD8_9PROT|nr:HD domain-containing protein [Limobrevibacterium gyesilva]MCW3475718.1 HD domain-containing protein [Limobrevibacterium gyesilva]
MNDVFVPHAALAEELLALLPSGSDGAHDLAHVLRVWANARRIAAAEGGDGEILTAAVLLHDCVHVEKSSPLRAQASRLAAARAADILSGRGWAVARTRRVAHAIAAHSFSAGIAPKTIEAKVLQDADRLDAIGCVGIARCFYTGGRMGSALYHPTDPAGRDRPLDDAAYALDHFRAKLLKLQDGFQTATGARLAAERSRVVADFLAAFETEIGADGMA